MLSGLCEHRRIREQFETLPGVHEGTPVTSGQPSPRRPAGQGRGRLSGDEGWRPCERIETLPG